MLRRRWLAFAIAVLLLLGAGAGGAYLWLQQSFTTAGPLAEPKTIVVPRGAGMRQVARQLAEAGAIRAPLPWIAGAEFFAEPKAVRAGEYALPAAISGRELLQLLQSGRVVVHQLTIPEGLMTSQVLTLVAGAEALAGELPAPLPGEGTLLPETYNYVLGDSRAELLERMRKALEVALAQAWSARDPSLPLASAHELLTLASIVEKETGIVAERPRVAAVFLNRLRHGMKLQADPTVAYGVTKGQAPLARSLTRADLEQATPYNTYMREGLPPGAIANPGKASLEAVARPAASEELYFVADGSGGHVFARTLDEHNRNVARWRQVQRRGAEGQK